MSDKAFQTVIVGHQCPTYAFSDSLYLNRLFGHKATYFVVVEQYDEGVAAESPICTDYVAQGNTA